MEQPNDESLENLTDVVHKVVNEIYKKRGYFITITREDTKAVLEAYFLTQVISEEINEVRQEDTQSNLINTGKQDGS